MLDDLIGRRAVCEADLLTLASLLVSFYTKAGPVRITGSQYRKRLAADLECVRADLTRTDYGVPASLVESVVRPQLMFLEENSKLFDARVRCGKVVEAHGDLRPEHICLEARPVIIDCLEFNRNLRILDAASELTFLALECERLGARDVGEFIFRRYSEETGDRPPDALLAFYKAWHACVRARIAVWHLKDEGVGDTAVWVAKADRYLKMAAGLSKAA
jgi:aminoglycoside phosphotransferase family enzyme